LRLNSVYWSCLPATTHLDCFALLIQRSPTPNPSIPLIHHTPVCGVAAMAYGMDGIAQTPFVPISGTNSLAQPCGLGSIARSVPIRPCRHAPRGEDFASDKDTNSRQQLSTALLEAWGVAASQVVVGWDVDRRGADHASASGQPRLLAPTGLMGGLTARHPRYHALPAEVGDGR
jgi:hypothetical protein